MASGKSDLCVCVWGGGRGGREGEVIVQSLYSCFHRCSLLYSGKLLREKTHKFCGFVAIHESFLREI